MFIVMTVRIKVFVLPGFCHSVIPYELRCFIKFNLVDLLTASWVFHAFLSSADFYQNQLFQKILSGIPSVSNSLYPDQARHFVGPVLGPNCLKKLSADDTRRYS